MMSKKILITYFSVFPAKDKFTEKFAKVIAKKTGGDMVEIQCATRYPQTPEEYPQIEAMAYEERDTDARPAIINEIPVDDYDVIFVGYPIWWYDMPQLMYSFFSEYDLSEKTIIPFNSHGGSGFSGSVAEIAELEPDATVRTDGLTLSRNVVADSEDRIVT